MLFSIKNISIIFDGSSVLENLSFTINRGDKIAITGASGSGKTTILNALMGFVSPTHGSILYDGDPLQGATRKKLRKEIAFLPQQINFPGYSVEEFIKMPFEYGNNKNLSPNPAAIKNIFNKLMLHQELITRELSEASGGEKQRIALASCLLLERKILFLDEPTAALDRETKQNILQLLLQDKNLTIISSSHDQEWIAGCNKIINLNEL